MAAFIHTSAKDTSAEEYWGSHALRNGNGRSLDVVQKAAEQDPLTGAFTVAGSTDVAYGGEIKLKAKPGTDLHFVAEVLDGAEKDAEIATLRSSFLLKQYAASSTGTPAAPVTVTCGLVFVDFADLEGGDIPALRDKLLGAVPGKTSELDAFMKRESGGRVALAVQTYTSPTAAPGSSGSWVRLPGKADDYRATDSSYLTSTFLPQVDKLVAFPDEWKFVIFAFPAVTGVPGARLKEVRSHCSTNTFDVEENGGQGQSVRYIVMAPQHYGDELGAHTTTIHEIMHALGLPDLYSMDAYRSFGWSMMSAAGAGIHLTGFEKLLLGWDSPANYQFLRRGTLSTKLAQQAAANGVKGIVLLPDPAAGRLDHHYLEVAQGVGVGDANRSAFTAANQADPGVLVISIRSDGRFGVVTPVVARRPADYLAAAKKYGGASEAPLKNGAQLRRNGFSLTVRTALDPATGTVDCLIGADKGFAPDRGSSVLRENERITNEDRWFALDPTGSPRLSGAPAVDDKGKPLTLPLRETDYGHTISVTDTGVLLIARAVGPAPAESDVLLRIAPPTPSPKGHHYLGVGPIGYSDRTGLSVIRVPDGAGTVVTVFTPLQTPPYALEPGWSTKGTWSVVYNSDGNVVVLKDGAFLEGSIQVYGDQQGAPQAVIFDTTGTMTWLKQDGSLLRAFASAGTGRGPFALGVDANADGTAWALLVKDSTGKSLGQVYSRVRRGWKTSEGDYALAFADDGAVTVSKAGAAIINTRTAFGDAAGTPQSIRFDAVGSMAWLRADSTTYRTFSGTPGIGPFRLAVDATDPARPALVVKDSANTVLYTVLGYRLDRLWSVDEQGFRVVIGSDGNVVVLKNGGFETGSVQVYEQYPQAVAFDAAGAMTWLASSGSGAKTFASTAGTGPFRLAVDSVGDSAWDLVVRDGTNQRLYSVYGTVNRGWSVKQDQLTIAFDADGALTVTSDGQKLSSRNAFAATDAAPTVLRFESDGTLIWLASNGTVIRTFAGPGGRGPFRLALDLNAAECAWQMVVKDSTGKTLYPVYGGIERGWSMTRGQWSLAFNANGLAASTEGRERLSTSTILAGATGAPLSVLFDADGAMTWIATDGTVMRRFEGKPGKGPFRPAVAATTAVGAPITASIDVVIEDAAKNVLYSVFNVVGPGWSTTDKEYTVVVGATGKVTVSRGPTVLAEVGTGADDSVNAVIVFGPDGAMSWRDDQGTILRSFPGSTGVGPFRLGAAADAAGAVSLVVRDSSGKSQYTVPASAPR